MQVLTGLPHPRRTGARTRNHPRSRLCGEPIPVPEQVAFSHLIWSGSRQMTNYEYADGDPIVTPGGFKCSVTGQVAGVATNIDWEANAANGKPGWVTTANDGNCASYSGNGFTFPSSLPYSLVVVGSMELRPSASYGYVTGDALFGVVAGRLGRTTAAGYVIDNGTGAIGSGTGVTDDDVHLFTAVFTSGADTLEVDGTSQISQNTGTNLPTTYSHVGLIAGLAIPTLGPQLLWGIYDGDVRTDPKWSDFEDWCETEYGLTIA